MLKRRKFIPRYNMAGLRCPECGSRNLIGFGRKWKFNEKKTKRIKIHQYQCKHCGRITVNPKKKEYD